MKVMSKEQGLILDRLNILAYGDSVLVEKAISVAARGTYVAPLRDVMAYIEKHRLQHPMNVKVEDENPQEPSMKKYTFNVKLFADITVEASSEREARKMLRETIGGSSANLGAWPNGDPIVCDVSLDDGDQNELLEIDGVSVD